MVNKASDNLDGYVSTLDSNEDFDFNLLPRNDLNYHFHDDTNFNRHSSNFSDKGVKSSSYPSSHRRSSSFESVLGHCLRNATCITSLNPRFAVKLDSVPIQELIASGIFESSERFFK
ncbi:unnamed protein product [Blepharisma stoltei]|uniref:Uncharacterized protein n=1 Tax=Blepharisma stoltei TaxID=1481888 RepID=A0AAU9J0V7_9CILI|nr:unnamed protein product [Blepharisma stoltei]